MEINPEYLYDCLRSGIRCLPLTLQLGLIPIVVGTVLGSLIAIARILKVPVVDKLFEVVVSIYCGIPFMVSLLIFHLIYLMAIPAFKNGEYWIALFALSLSRTFHLSEVIRGAFLAIPKDQYEASYAMGLTTFQAFTRIIIPQMVPVALPTMANNVVGSIKNTSEVFVLGLLDVLNGSQLPCSETYSFVEGYVAAAAIYWVVNMLIEWVLSRVNRVFTKQYAQREEKRV